MRGHTITIVSNNSVAAITAYLDSHDLTAWVTGIIGRTETDPSLLKPHPHLLNQAIRARHAQMTECVLIGDSVTDVQAAHNAGTASIAYANKPGKRERLASFNPNVIITDMAELAAAVSSPGS